LVWRRLRSCERLSLNYLLDEVVRPRGVIGLSVLQSNGAQGGRAHTDGRMRCLPGRRAIAMRCEAAGSVPAVAVVVRCVSSLCRLARQRHRVVVNCRTSRIRVTYGTSAPAAVRAGSGPAHSWWVHSALPGRACAPARGMAASFLQQWQRGRACTAASASHLRRRTRWDEVAESDRRSCPGSAGRRLAGTRGSQKAKRTALRESPFMRSLSGVWMLHHHSSRRKARAVTALCRRPVDRGASPSPEGTE
jgi:hypothetical protein